MKKLISLALVIITVFSVMAVALAAVSPKPDIRITWEPEKGKSTFFFMVSNDERKHKAAAQELAELAAAETLDEYFGAAADEAKKIVGDEPTVVEFAPVVAGNYTEDMGNVKLTIDCPTKYEADQKVAILFGIDGDWKVYEGTGTASGKVEVTLDPEMVLAVQNSGNALMAIAI